MEENQQTETRKSSVKSVLVTVMGMLAAFSLGVMMSMYRTDAGAAAAVSKNAVPTPVPTAEPTPEPTPVPTPVIEIPAGNAFDAQALDALEAYADSLSGNVSIWLCDLSTGQSFYHKDGGYYCASTLKAPYALWLCMRDECGEINLDTPLNGGTGWELLHEMIAKSSNSATATLSAKWPASLETGFAGFVEDLGFGSPDGCEVVREGIHGWLTAQDGGRAMLAIYNYILTGSDNARNLEAALLDADHEILWYPGVAAKKYGSWDRAFHDMAIVYGEKPYIISVFSNWGREDNSFPEPAVARMQKIGHLAAAALGLDTEAE